MPFQLYGGGGGSPSANLDVDFEILGLTSDGTGTQVTTGSSNTKGSYVTMGTSSFDYCGITLVIGPQSTAADRYLFDVSFDNGTTAHISNVFNQIAAGNGMSFFYFDKVKATSSSIIRVRAQSSSATRNVNVYVIGWKRTANDPPGFTSCTNIVADTTTSFASTVDLTLDNTWIQHVASSADKYSAFALGFGHNGSAPSTQQSARVSLGTGASSSEVELFAQGVVIGTGSPYFRGQGISQFKKTVNAGTRISLRANATTPGTDALRVAIYGFKE